MHTYNGDMGTIKHAYRLCTRTHQANDAAPCTRRMEKDENGIDCLLYIKTINSTVIEGSIFGVMRRKRDSSNALRLDFSCFLSFHFIIHSILLSCLTVFLFAFWNAINVCCCDSRTLLSVDLFCIYTCDETHKSFTREASFAFFISVLFSWPFGSRGANLICFFSSKRKSHN